MYVCALRSVLTSITILPNNNMLVLAFKVKSSKIFFAIFEIDLPASSKAFIVSGIVWYYLFIRARQNFRNGIL